MALVNFRELRTPPAIFAAASLLLILGGLLIGAGLWLRPVFEAERAADAGDAALAVEQYHIAHQRFDRVPFIKTAVPALYDRVVANELSLLYSLLRFDDIIDKASAEESNPAAPFWAGCALFDKGLMEERPQARTGWISQAHQEFRRALDLAPDDWDAKFNYELTGKLVSGLQKQPQTSRQDMMKLLRESPNSQRDPVRKAG
jgi:hypothetical protein